MNTVSHYNQTEWSFLFYCRCVVIHGVLVCLSLSWMGERSNVLMASDSCMSQGTPPFWISTINEVIVQQWQYRISSLFSLAREHRLRSESLIFISLNELVLHMTSGKANWVGRNWLYIVPSPHTFIKSPVWNPNCIVLVLTLQFWYLAELTITTSNRLLLDFCSLTTRI